MLVKPSNDQINILNCLSKNNVLIDSVAGSGKTTTNLHIAKKYTKYNILLLTYNSKLKIETREKVRLHNIKNLEVHSYHSFCVKNYDRSAFRDNEILKIVTKNTKSINKFKYDLIVLDEAQDINPLYYQLVNKIYKDNLKHKKSKNETQICILGDKYQSIYDFNNADNRFIIYGDKCFNFNKLNWSKCSLGQSFRITTPMSSFINNCMLNYNRITSHKKGIKPEYIICDTFGELKGKCSKPFEIIKDLLKKYNPDDIFVLAPSVKSVKTPVRKLENKIKTELENVPIYVPNNDDESIDKSIIENKLVISTFHQTKGLERKVVLVFNFDNSYFKFYKKDKNPMLCPNELYVSTTRASEHLILFHHYRNDYLPFLNVKKLPEFSDYQIEESLSVTSSNKSRNINTSPTDLCNHLTDHIMSECMTYFKIKNIKKKKKTINIPSKTKQRNTYESVSDINGTAIPLYFEYKKKGIIKILDELSDNENNTEFGSSKYSNNSFSNNTSKYSDNEDSDELCIDSEDESEEEFQEQKEYKIQTIKQHVIDKKLSIDELLYITNRWTTFKNGYLFKIKQITDYSWLSQNDVDRCMKNLEKLNISDKAIFEKKLVIENKPELLNRKITGYMDCLDYNKIYEFKCVGELENKHYLQLAIYAYINEITQAEYVKRYNANLTKDYSSVMVGDIITFNGGYGYVEKKFPNGDIHIKNLVTLEVTVVNNGSLENKEKTKRNNSYYMYNILTDELNEMEYDIDNLKKMMEYLIYNKYVNKVKKTDKEFLLNVEKLKK